MTAVWQFFIWITLIGLTTSIDHVAKAIRENPPVQCPQKEAK